MRDYGRVAPTFWTRGSGKKLRGKPMAQVVALYLFTCPASSMIGIYHLAIPTMAHEVGLTIDDAEQALADVCDVGIAQYDAEEELVYLPEGARYQIGERLKSGDKRVAGIRAALAQFSRHPFAADFARRYAADFCLPAPEQPEDAEAPSKPLPETLEAPSKPLRRGSGATQKPLGSQARQGADQVQEQESHTHIAGARAREGHDEDKGRPSEPGAGNTATTESLLAAVAKHPLLLTLHGDRRWAMHLAGVFVSAGVCVSDVDAAVDAFVADNAAKAPEDGPALDEFVRDGVGRYLKKAKEHGDAARRRAARDSDRGSGPIAASDDVRVVLGVFGEIWAARKKKPFVQAAGDEKHAATIVSRAWEEAGKLKIRPREVVRHWATEHLKSVDKWVVESNHALATMGSRLTDYGLPSTKPAAPPTPREPEPAFADPAANAAALSALTSALGTGAKDQIIARRT